MERRSGKDRRRGWFQYERFLDVLTRDRKRNIAERQTAALLKPITAGGIFEQATSIQNGSDGSMECIQGDLSRTADYK